MTICSPYCFLSQSVIVDLFFVSGDRSILPSLDPEEEKMEEEKRKQAESVGLRPGSPKEKKVNLSVDE